MDFEQKYQKDPGMNRVKNSQKNSKILKDIGKTLSQWGGNWKMGGGK